MTTTDVARIGASPLTSCPRSSVQRAAKRASYDRETAYRLIDRLKTAHLGFVEEGEPRIIRSRPGDWMTTYTCTRSMVDDCHGVWNRAHCSASPSP